MNIGDLHALRAASLLTRPHQHGALTRRQFLKAGATATAVAMGSGLGYPQSVWAESDHKTSSDPHPIPYGTQFLAAAGNQTVFHVEAPGYPMPGVDTNPATHDPATITDFNGFVGLAYVGGQGTHHDLVTRQTASLYWEVDMRFMVGEYIGKDGRHHHATFGFVWLDVFDQSGQIHDFNPGIASDGRFWTMALDPESVEVHSGSGRAVYQAQHLPMPDYHDFANGATGGSPVPGIVSFRVEWAPSHDKHHYHYAPHKWEGSFVQTSATCAWSGRTEFATFSTDTNNPTIFAEVGHERSGVFF